MSDKNEEKSWWQKLLLWVVTSPVTVILLGAAAYYGARAYLLDIEPWRSKVLMFAALGLWVLWLVFKNLIKFLLLLAVVGAIAYGYYRYVNRDEIACKEAGRVWNEEKQICEDKLTFMEKLEKMWNEYWDGREEDKTAGDSQSNKLDKGGKKEENKEEK